MKERKTEGSLVSKAVNGARGGVWAELTDCGTKGQGEKTPGTDFILFYYAQRSAYVYYMINTTNGGHFETGQDKQSVEII